MFLYKTITTILFFDRSILSLQKCHERRIVTKDGLTKDPVNRVECHDRRIDKSAREYSFFQITVNLHCIQTVHWLL